MTRFARFLRGSLVALFLFGLLGIAGIGVLYWLIAPRLPDVQELRRVQMQMPLSIYSRDGGLIAQIGETRRYPVAIAEVPARVKNAFIAIEDARFYQHPGIDWRGIARAVWLLATTDGRVPGGSTITQQVARQFFLSAEYSYTRKLTEIFLALKIEQALSKDEILELYLNKSFFGNRAYGVAAAAEFYYGKPLDQLSLAEAAMLASIPKFPSSGNPIINPQRALIRRNYVLQRMAEEGLASPSEVDAARAEVDAARPHEPKIEVEAPYVAEMVRVWMEERYGADATSSGYRVITTLEGAHQNAAAQSVRNGLLEYDRRRGWRGPERHVEIAEGVDPAQLRSHLRDLPSVGGLDAALVLATGNDEVTLLGRSGDAIALTAEHLRWTGKSPGQLLKRGDIVRIAYEPDGKPVLAQIPAAQATLVSLQHADGAVRALVGGFSYALNKFNRATQAQRQPGSSFKPFVYAAAFERGYTPGTIVLDAPVVFRDRANNVWRPQNDAGDFAGPMRLREAMVQSRNLVSVRLLDAIGVDYTRRYLTNFGFSLDSVPPNLSMSLGTASLTPLSIARGYAVFANGGHVVEPWFVERVLDRDENPLYEADPLVACPGCTRASGPRPPSGEIDGFDFSAGGPSVETEPMAEASADAAPIAADTALRRPAPRTVDERTAFLVRSLLYDVVRRGTGTAARVIGREDIGGKTGSTNEHRDAWFSGIGGDLATTVWVGKDDFTTLGGREYGGKAALPIWIGFMTAALEGVPLADPSPPLGIISATISPDSGHLLPDGTPGGIREYFKREDFDRLAAGGYQQELGSEDEAAFDIF
ncbi:MAG TPA: penicillin-binding protein 1A [Arenimonas sp.]|nr:penicillin-binding protein 1A [Arenimonas sp.]